MDKNITTNLTQLSELQEVDTNLEAIVKLRGTLPEEVVELERSMEKLSLKIANHEALLITLREAIESNKELIKSSEKKIQQYESQQMEVHNNREYNAITKELELHILDIQLAEKFLRTTYEKIAEETTALEEMYQLFKLKEVDLFVKKEGLESMLQASEAEELVLHKKRKEIIVILDNLLYTAYERIRQNIPNNLAVVPIKKGACGGCCIVIPPQQKLVVYERNKIVLCEHCGRMLIVSEQSMNEMLLGI